MTVSLDIIEHVSIYGDEYSERDDNPPPCAHDGERLVTERNDVKCYGCGTVLEHGGQA